MSITDALASDIVATRHWTKLPDGRVRCDVCPRECKLHEGQRGLCFVRAAQGGEIVLTTWGRSSGFCVDPIEKKPLNHFLPGTPVLSFGTAGCNLSCAFCQNWDISKSRETDTLADRATPEMIAAAAVKLGCRSVAFTYNDPTIFFEYAIDVAEACRAVGVKSVAVTAGYMSPAPRAEFYRHVDAANVDLKAFTEEFYFKITKSHLQPVLDTLEYIKHETQTWLEITTLVIPGENDSPGEIERLSRWVVERLGPDVPLHFSAFHPDYRMLDKPRTPQATHCPWRAASPWSKAFATPMSAMFTMSGGRAPIAINAAPVSSNAIGTRLAAGVWMARASASLAEHNALACLTGRRANGDRSGFP